MEKRTGRFTGSVIYKLTSPGTFDSYVNDKYAEITMGTSVETKVKVRAMLWGSLMEHVAFDKIPLNEGYKMLHKETAVHPKYDFWATTPDYARFDTIADAKCLEPKAFFALSEVIINENLYKFKNKFKQQYWQIVNGCIIFDVPFGEIITYMPYKDDLEVILNEMKTGNYLETKGLNPGDYYNMINYTKVEDLPHLPNRDNPLLKDLNRFKFKVPKEDKEFLTAQVLKANEALQIKLKSRI